MLNDVTSKFHAVKGSDLTQKEHFASEMAALDDIQQALRESSSESYIACLSEKPDQLSQWRGYARDGFCIGFDAEILASKLTVAQTMRPVRYFDDPTTESGIARGESLDYINKLIERSREARCELLRDNEVSLDTDITRYAIAKPILEEASFMKNRGFKEERVVRIVELGAQPSIFTSSSRYGTIPRIEIRIPDGCINTVIVGPCAHHDLKMRSMIKYFVNNPFKRGVPEPRGYRTQPKVRRSRIPFRDW
jgi:hypothetical protein